MSQVVYWADRIRSGFGLAPLSNPAHPTCAHTASSSLVSSAIPVLGTAATLAFVGFHGDHVVAEIQWLALRAGWIDAPWIEGVDCFVWVN